MPQDSKPRLPTAFRPVEITPELERIKIIAVSNGAEAYDGTPGIDLLKESEMRAIRALGETALSEVSEALHKNKPATFDDIVTAHVRHLDIIATNRYRNIILNVRSETLRAERETLLSAIVQVVGILPPPFTNYAYNLFYGRFPKNKSKPIEDQLVLFNGKAPSSLILLPGTIE